MITSFFVLEKLDAWCKIEQEWLFEELMGKQSHRHIILSADQGLGVQEYLRKLDQSAILPGVTTVIC